MDILIPDLKKLEEARDAGELVDSSYIKAHFDDDMEELLQKYDYGTAQDVLELLNYVKSLTAESSKILNVLEYFGLTEYIIG